LSVTLYEHCIVFTAIRLPNDNPKVSSRTPFKMLLVFSQLTRIPLPQQLKLIRAVI